MARESILISELMDNYQKTHPVSDEQARAEYDRIAKLQRESASDQEYKVRHILVEKEDEAKAIIAKLKKGEKFEAIAKKQSKELYDRQYYTGYCGWVSNNGQTLFVNLRCMQITNNEVYLYVGGGITKDSVPEKEYEETQNKAMTMMTII